MNNCTDRRTRIAIFPGIYAGASFGWNISVPMILPKAKDTRVMALMVFCSVLK